MKTAACLLLSFATALSLQASDISDLATGYASAFQAMNKSTVTIAYTDNGQPAVIKNVKEVRAFGGALLIKVNTGDQMILSSGSVLRIAE
jgi:hypothetical protein